jgi:guanine deaminase
MIRILKGTLLHTPEKDRFSVHPDSYLVIRDGLVEGIYGTLPDVFGGIPVEEYPGKLLIPGFVDLHAHAPQYLNCGIGYDEELLPWLRKYTFPLESRYEDIRFAEAAYKRFIADLWRAGTTRASVFATRHLPATKLLFELFRESGLGAYVGKVNMDRNAVPALEETAEVSLAETEEYILGATDPKGLVKPIITPRFVPCTTPALMTGLGLLAEKYDVPIQSHLSENRDEIALVKQLHPEIGSFTEVYETYGLLRRSRTIMAHGVYLDAREQEILLEREIYIAHSPQSNFNVSSGTMPLRRYLESGMRMGLASDVAGGHMLSMPHNIVTARMASNQYWVDHPDCPKARLSEVFYLATKGSGAFFGKVGSFETGYEADVLVVDDRYAESLVERTPEERLQRFIYAGDDRNIEKRIVRGEDLPCPWCTEGRFVLE